MMILNFFIANGIMIKLEIAERNVILFPMQYILKFH